MSVFARRLKEARSLAGLSQERLGVLAGIDPMSASARLNQYEKGKHEPNVQITRQIAQVLNLPEAFFYAADDDVAKILLLFYRLPREGRAQALEVLELLTASEGG